jgi:CMP-N,N'-diacetyllegionaminic acid synthase
MRIFPLILARGGSKRLPGKNKRELVGLPLIAWTIKTAKFIKDFEEIVVSTDDEEIAEISRSYGASVPWIRPIEVSGDYSTSAESALHALNWAETEIGKFDAVLLLQPTSPFRTIDTINNGIAMFNLNPDKCIIGVRKKQIKSSEFLIEKSNGYLGPLSPINKLPCSQSELYLASGNFFMASCDNLKKYKDFYIENAQPLFSSFLFEEIDIDTQDDFLLAEQIASHARDFLPW